MKFKSLEEEQEWRDKQLDERLRVILWSLEGYVKERFGREIEITEIFRTREEQEKIYGRGAPKSVHELWRGIDISVRGFKEAEIKEIVEWLNKRFEYGKEKKTAIYHDVGLGKHIHLQVNTEGITKLKR